MKWFAKAVFTYEVSSLYPEGIEYVIKNGEAVIENGQHTGHLPGSVLQHATDHA